MNKQVYFGLQKLTTFAKVLWSASAKRNMSGDLPRNIDPTAITSLHPIEPFVE
jgi:hypothetical protein